METMTQEPQLTKVQLEKKNAMQDAFDQIEAITGSDANDQTKIESAKNLLEEIRGTNYRLEQAVAKLVEYFEMEAEVTRRREEITTILPGANLRSSNDPRFLQDDKFLVAA